MQRNKELHKFLLNRAEQLTEEWYESLDKSGTGVYASTDPEAIRKLKAQNFEFHQHLCKIFIMEKEAFFKEFDDWVIEIGRDPEHLNTPTYLIMREFLRVREQYLGFINDFVDSLKTPVSQELIDIWKFAVIEAIDVVMTNVVEEKNKHLNKRIEEQQQTINDLSSPLIDLPEGKALLPLVGDIDSDRATAILDNTLQGCTTKRVDHLFIDLSGVYLVDTRVAQQIFQLITGLKLIGVTTTLSGLRPEIAQTAVQLGIDFGEINITSNLASAISMGTN
ncbi:STAS domain-containing protein [Pseudalkalibacillus hwajinpoensis]|uniref:STAS domain-containing protein n=1 Tax=Guptibacillus hwajinpoensis TaxID=208199 RepID=A0A4U1MNH8_9BACL|nr:STAS domain-containing protein [Pseudalkalibacillus hwajinpoensis]TKD72374.1 STAS domain-containing protein [Pseudalkalibacillus hwajinpoensis]